MIALTRKQRAHVIVHNAAVAAGGIGAGWISDLVLLPDAVPLGVLQAVMMFALLRLFELRLHKSLALAAVAAFCASLIGRGLSMLLYLVLPSYEMYINVAVAILMTELLGGATVRVCLALLRRSAAPSSWVTAMLQVTRREPVRMLLISAPMIVAGVAAFVVLNVRHVAEIRVAAPGGGQTWRIDHPLVERHQGLLRLSGQPQREANRVLFEVRNDVLVAQLEDRVFRRSPPQVQLVAQVAPGAAPSQVIDAGWQTEVVLVSNYWRLVRGRLYLLILGLLGTLLLVWLGHRAERTQPA